MSPARRCTPTRADGRRRSNRALSAARCLSGSNSLQVSLEVRHRRVGGRCSFLCVFLAKLRIVARRGGDLRAKVAKWLRQVESGNEADDDEHEDPGEDRQAF